jgi:RecA/RadA recombinase
MMVVRTQVTLDAEAHRRAKKRAAELGISFAEYVRQAVDHELGPRQQEKSDISEISGMFGSGETDVSANIHYYVGKAIEEEYEQSIRRR